MDDGRREAPRIQEPESRRWIRLCLNRDSIFTYYLSPVTLENAKTHRGLILERAIKRREFFQFLGEAH